MTPIPPDAPVLVIFGAAVRPDGTPSGAMQERVAAALRFGAALDGAVYMPTGGVGQHGDAEADVMADMLLQAGVPPAQIVREPTAVNTLRSVLACAALLRGHRGLVYAATSAYHLPRCVLLLRLAGLRTRACPPGSSPAASSLLRRWYWRLREVPAVPVDAAILLWMRFRP